MDLEVHAVVRRRHRGLKVLATTRDGDDLVPKAQLGQFEAGPVQARIEFIGDCNHLGRRRGTGVVFKINTVGDGILRPDVACYAKAAWPNLLVGIHGAH